MTSDEWVRRGIDFALSKYDPLDEELIASSSAVDDALAALERAKECFARGGNARLRDVASLQEGYLSWMRRLKALQASSTSQEVGPKEELELLKFASNCTKACLLDEVKRLVVTVCELAPEGDKVFIQQLFKRYFD